MGLFWRTGPGGLIRGRLMRREGSSHRRRLGSAILEAKEGPSTRPTNRPDRAVPGRNRRRRGRARRDHRRRARPRAGRLGRVDRPAGRPSPRRQRGDGLHPVAPADRRGRALIAGYDEPEWARRLHYDRPIATSIAVLRAVRAASLELLERLTASERTEPAPTAIGRVLRRRLAPDLRGARARPRRPDPARPGGRVDARVSSETVIQSTHDGADPGLTAQSKHSISARQANSEPIPRVRPRPKSAPKARLIAVREFRRTGEPENPTSSVGDGGRGERGHRLERRIGPGIPGGVAPPPGRSWRRSIQTVGSRAAGPGTWSWNRLWATWRIRPSRRRRPRAARQRAKFRSSGLYEPTCWAVTIQSNSTPSRSLEPRRVVVAVRQDTEPEARLEPDEASWESGRRASRDRAAERASRPASASRRGPARPSAIASPASTR